MTPASHATPTPRFSGGRLRRRSAAAAVVGLALALAAIGLAWRRASHDRDRAQQRAAAAQAVADFLRDLPRHADPRGERGPALTVRETLDAGRARLLAAGDGPPETRAALLRALAAGYRGVGLTAEARPLLLEALVLARAHLAGDDLALADSLADLGALLLESGRGGGGPYLEEALRIREGALGPLHPAVAEVLLPLAVAFQQEGEPDLAVTLLERALTIRRASLAAGDPRIAESLLALAAARIDAGDPEGAGTLARQGLAILESGEPRDEAAIAAARSLLGESADAAPPDARDLRTAPPP